MEFIKKYQIDVPQMTIEQTDDCSTRYMYNLIEKIHTISLERHEKALIGEIIRIAKEQGVTDLYILNKESISELFSKQIPKMPSIYPMVGVAECPSCERRIEAHASHNYCCYCGQKLEWMRKAE